MPNAKQSLMAEYDWEWMDIPRLQLSAVFGTEEHLPATATEA